MHYGLNMYLLPWSLGGILISRVGPLSDQVGLKGRGSRAGLGPSQKDHREPLLLLVEDAANWPYP